MPKRTDIHSVLIIGAGPIVIGQACEFDYSGTQACKALKEDGYRVILVNSNPATIMTDPEFADRTYIEPITAECVEKIIVRELEEMKRVGVAVDEPPIANHQAPSIKPLPTSLCCFLRWAGRRLSTRRWRCIAAAHWKSMVSK